MGKWSHVVLAAAAMSLPAAAAAQMVDPAGHPLGADRRVSVGLSIPLGGGAESSGKPQLELRAVADHRSAQASDRESIGWLPRTQPRETRIGVTLTEQPRLTIAGRELPEAENKLGISTIAWVAIGVAAAAVVGSLLLVDAINDASE
jgi:hypothetical protein